MTPLKQMLLGAPKDPTDPHVFHKISLAAFLAWVGMGADGLSSSCYGPEEAFRALHGHEYMAFYLALLMAFTVGVISYAYSKLIEHFPSGGGGYVVASKLLGPRAGLVSGSALTVDYILTVTVSIASGMDALFSMLPVAWQIYKLPAALSALALLTLLNLRGVKESVKALLPIFLVFVATHAVLILMGVFGNLSHLPAVLGRAHSEMARDGATLGWVTLAAIFLRAFSLGGGTYTGIEAVSNGVVILKEPRVPTAKRTMLYMALSLAFTAAGILLCYLILDIAPLEGRTMNAVLLGEVFGGWRVAGWHAGGWLVAAALASEGALLVVAAQAGFIDGPRVLSTMAVDSWVPHRFGNLSERLVTRNGILLVGLAAGVLMAYTRGSVSLLVVLYSINVFLTFSLSQLAMVRFWTGAEGRGHRRRAWNLTVHGTALVLCVGILAVTITEKFAEGGWLTLIITSSLVVLCMLIQRHYSGIRSQIREMDTILGGLSDLSPAGPAATPDPAQPVAVLMVSGYSGLGVHALLSIQRLFPSYYRNVIFLSVGVVDSGRFKGPAEMEALTHETEANLQRYVDVARGLGLRASYRYAFGTDVVQEADRLGSELAREYPRAVFFLGKLIFAQERWTHRILHNDTAFAIQRRLQFQGIQTVILPIRMTAD